MDSNIHFITGSGPLALDYIYQPYVHGAAVMHSDGSPVAPGLPATAGETVVVYGYGFGRPTNAVETGVASQTANPVPLYDRFQFSALLPENSGVSSGTGENLGSYISYVGLTPGAVGVYQMNFKVPPAPGIRPCDGATTSWNFMVTATGRAGSFESFAFCVR